MNIQREAIYTKRNNALSGDRLAVDINTMFTSLTESLVIGHRQNGSYETFREASLKYAGIDPEITKDEFDNGNEDNLIDRFETQFLNFYHDKNTKIAEYIMPFIRNVHENQANQYKRVSIPFATGLSKGMNVSADIADAMATDGKSISRDIEKAIALSVIDEEWKEHLRSMLSLIHI